MSDVVIDSMGGSERLRAAVSDLRPALKQIGERLSGLAQEAFARRRFGEERWPEQYPRQSAPFVHVAGALSDLNRGAVIKARRFERGDPLQDTGNLLGSISWQLVAEDTVRIGTSVEYAGLMCLGGTSQQPVTAGAKERLRKWIASRKRKRERGRKGARSSGTNPLARDVAKPDPVVQRLRFLLDIDVLETEVHPRPFLGLTEEARADIRTIIETELARQAGGDHGDR